MKKQLLALAVGSMVVVPSVALADKGPTVYGKVNVSYENQDNGTNDEWKLESNSSRIGVKGALDLDVDQLKAVYQAEFQIAVDDGDNKGQTFSQRNIFGGFEHATLGRLIAGKFDSPFKKSQGEIDQFGDLRGDINTIVGGSERISNIIQYSTPKLANAVTVNVAMVPGEGNTDFADRRDGPADGISSSVVFDNGMLYGSVGYDSEVKTNLFDLGDADTLVDAMHVAAKLNMDQFEVGALKVDRWKLKAQYGVTDTDLTDDKVKLTAVGADYKMAKASKVFGYFAKVESDNTGAGALAIDDTTFGIGFEHKFSM